jgi:thiamine-monophosphate kinase
MGGTPFGFTLSLGVPSSVESAHLEDFSRSLSTLCQQWGLLLLGGDTVCSELIFVDVVVLGTVAPSEILCQRGAQEGDALWVTGTLGGSRNLLDKMHSVREEGRTFCLDDPAWMPPVRWNLLPTLRKILPVRAMTDLSDGLALDLHKILRWENLGARIDVELLPLQENRLLSPIPSLPWGEEEERLSSYRNAWLGGEDYELLIVEKGNAQPIGHLCIEDVTLTRIGQVLGTRQGVHLAWQGTEIEIEGEPFQHFGETG